MAPGECLIEEERKHPNGCFFFDQENFPYLRKSMILGQGSSSRLNPPSEAGAEYYSGGDYNTRVIEEILTI
ncbi:hypothetical protein J25TS5_54790 [Paenibacillus faecis]|nr:hypothetical protein J25TS5_54790 [Paenibacillus faecis]